MMLTKKRILIFIDWFIPAFKAGGPIQSVNNLVHKFSNEFDIYIVTSDRDLGDLDSYKTVELNVWLKKTIYDVIYLSPENQNEEFYKQIIQEKNIEKVYLNSLFSIPFAFKALRAALQLDVEVILAPRGMLGKGALRLKTTKKKVFLTIFKLLKYHKKITFHATSDEEEQEIKSYFGKHIKCVKASNLPSKVPEFQLREKNVGELNLFFLSRVNEKKNLLGALNILKKIKANGVIHFNIYGPIDGEEYWKKCQDLITKLPNHISCAYKGSLPHDQISESLKEEHLLFLPTQNENFGHVIMEAWQQSCPVLISDQTPWKNLELKKSGWEFPLKEELAFVSTLENILAMNQSAFDVYSKASHDFAMQFSENPELVSSNRKLLV